MPLDLPAVKATSVRQPSAACSTASCLPELTALNRHHHNHHHRQIPIPTSNSASKRRPSRRLTQSALHQNVSHIPSRPPRKQKESRKKARAVQPQQHPATTANMAERQLQQILSQLKSQSSTLKYADAAPLLSKAKLQLLKLNALSPSPATLPSQSLTSQQQQQQPSQSALALARETYEQGALYSIRAKDPEAFTRYVTQLAPFYELPASVLAPSLAERNKVTGLYLLLLLTQGRYAEFHSELESLSTREGGGGSVDVEGDRFLGYPIRLERWLMEGSYDRVWKAMKSREVPSEEFGVFSEVSGDMYS